MLSLCELRRAAEIIDRGWAGSRVERWLQPDGDRLIITLYRRDPDSGEGGKRHLLLCARDGVGRVSELARPLRAMPQPPALSAFLRSNLGRARLLRASILDDDRQLAIRFESREGDFDLVLSLLGRRSNIYLLDAGRRLVSALHSLKDTRPELEMGAAFTSPARSVPTEGEDRFPAATESELLAAFEGHYAEEESDRNLSELAARLSKVLRKERKNAERRLVRIEEELAEADQATLLQHHGELLKASLGSVVAGSDEVTVRDYASGEDVAIPLDRKLSAKGNLEKIFKRYHKLIRRLTKAGGRVDAARTHCEEMAALVARCAELAEQGDQDAAARLDEIAARPAVARLLARAAAPIAAGATRDLPSNLPPRLRDVPRKLLPRRYVSVDELEIWVGRSDEANDHLSTRLASGNDLFFHVEGAPGSHVILRTEGRPDPPSESLIDACELAVHFSKQKNASRADLHVVPIKNVKKPKGAKAGLVYVTGGKTIHLRRDEARLERVLNSKLDD